MSKTQANLNNLQVKTIELKPATIIFNHEEIEKELDNTLKKYENLIFTEEDTTELRNTIAEVRKGKTALNRYRIDTKKELNKTGDEFDQTVKKLDAKFDGVIAPLVNQQVEFEETRKKEKRIKVQEILDGIIESFELDHERADELEIIDSYLTKSKTIKSITDELTTQAEHLKLQQDKEKADKSMIETTVKLANSENELSLSVEAYVRLLEFQDAERVKDQIENDIKKEVIARELAAKRELERIEREKEQKRLEEEKQKSQEEVEKKADLEKHISEQNEIIAEENRVVLETIKNIEIDDMPFNNSFENEPVVIEDMPMTEVDPFADEDLPFLNSHASTEKIYEVYGSKQNLEKLEIFMNENNIEWRVKGE